VEYPAGAGKPMCPSGKKSWGVSTLRVAGVVAVVFSCVQILAWSVGDWGWLRIRLSCVGIKQKNIVNILDVSREGCRLIAYCHKKMPAYYDGKYFTWQCLDFFWILQP
jgi:hypothetical protein